MTSGGRHASPASPVTRAARGGRHAARTPRRSGQQARHGASSKTDQVRTAISVGTGRLGWRAGLALALSGSLAVGGVAAQASDASRVAPTTLAVVPTATGSASRVVEAHRASRAGGRQAPANAVAGPVNRSPAPAELLTQAKGVAAERADAATAATARESARRARQQATAAATRPRWVAPIPGAGQSARFGDHGGLWRERHTGQDFTAPSGTPVRVAGDGVVVSAGWDGAYGLVVRVAHADGTQTWYAHLSEVVRSEGAVHVGEVIGRVGQSGNATGPHLHFEVRPGGGEPVDPLTWLADAGVTL